MIARVALSSSDTTNQSSTGVGHATSSISEIQFDGRQSIATNLTINFPQRGIFMDSEDTASASTPGGSEKTMNIARGELL